MSDDIKQQIQATMENLHSRQNQQSKQQSYKPSSRQVHLINALWDRMTQLYRNRWISSEGDKLEDYGPMKGQLTENFNLWCRKTENLTDEEWRRGFETLEKRVETASAAGDTPWPPSYAEFLGLCRKPKEQGAYGGAYKPFFPNGRRLEEPQEHRSKRKRDGIENLERLKSIFDD